MSTPNLETEIDAIGAKIDMLILGMAELRREVERLEPPTKAPRIVKACEAWRELGYPDYETLWRKIGGLYRVGIEAYDRRQPESKKPDWYINVDRALERDQQLSATRG